MLVVTEAIIYYLFVAGTDQLMRNYVGAKYSSSRALIRVLMNVPPALVYLLSQRKFMLRELWRNFSIASFVAFVFAHDAVIDRGRPNSASFDPASNVGSGQNTLCHEE